jgi:hypothetical protein
VFRDSENYFDSGSNQKGERVVRMTRISPKPATSMVNTVAEIHETPTFITSLLFASLSDLCLSRTHFGSASQGTAITLGFDFVARYSRPSFNTTYPTTDGNTINSVMMASVRRENGRNSLGFSSSVTAVLRYCPLKKTIVTHARTTLSVP